MKLYEVPRFNTIVLENGTELYFHHIDGMYSYCTDDKGNVTHLPASINIEIKKKEDVV